MVKLLVVAGMEGSKEASRSDSGNTVDRERVRLARTCANDDDSVESGRRLATVRCIVRSTSVISLSDPATPALRADRLL